MSSKNIQVLITRQNNPKSSPYTEEFSIPYRPNMNIIAVLIEIQKNPVNAKGVKTTPVVWESVCLEEVCGACSMLVNGKAQQSCSSLIDQLEQPIRLAPLSTFPVVRDLLVDRQRMFDSLRKVKAWVPIDGSFPLGSGPRLPERTREWAYELSKCMTCGCCLEACPNVNSKSSFIGPAAISQARLFNAHPTGEWHKEGRLDALMGEGGLTECGNSQNCVRACPKGIPLTTSIAHMNRQVVVHSFKKFLGNY